MDSKKRRSILCLDPVKSKMTYYIDGEHESMLNRETYSFNYMVDDILEQIIQCVNKHDGLYDGGKIRVDVKVSYKKK